MRTEDVPALTIAQWRLLEELSEPNRNPENEWKLSGKYRRPAIVLDRFGFAKIHELYPYLVASITDEGRRVLPMSPERQS